MESEFDKSELIKDLSAVLISKFSSNQAKRDLSDALIGLKLYKTEKLVEALLSALDSTKLKGVTEESLTSQTIVDGYYSGYGKIEHRFNYIKDSARALKAVDVLMKVRRVLLIHLLNEAPDKREKALSVLNEGMETIFFIEGENPKNIPKELRLDNLPVSLTKNEKIDSPQYKYWPHGAEKLHKLYDALLENNFIKENPVFFQTFSSFPVKLKDKTTWLGTQTQLVYAAYIIYSGVTVDQRGSIFSRIQELFKKSANEEFDEKVLSTTYSNIRDQITPKEDLSSHLVKIKIMLTDIGIQ